MCTQSEAPHINSFLLSQNWSLRWKCGLELVLHFLCQFPCVVILLVTKLKSVLKLKMAY